MDENFLNYVRSNNVEGISRIKKEKLLSLIKKNYYDGNTALTLAADRGNLEMIKFILSNLKDHDEIFRYISRENSYGNTAMILAVNYGCLETIEFLLSCCSKKEQHSILTHKNNVKATSLMCAANDGYIDIIKLILSISSNDKEYLTNKNSYNVTALYYTVRKRHLRVFKLLSENIDDIMIDLEVYSHRLIMPPRFNEIIILKIKN